MPSVSLPMSVASQVDAVIRYRVPSVTALPVIIALTSFSRALPDAGSTTRIVGAVRSMLVIVEEWANAALPTLSLERKQTRCPLYASSSSVMISPEVYAVPSSSLPMRPSSHSSSVMTY